MQAIDLQDLIRSTEWGDKTSDRGGGICNRLPKYWVYLLLMNLTDVYISGKGGGLMQLNTHQYAYSNLGWN